MARRSVHTKLTKTVRDMLTLIGENPDREGLLDTPDRVTRMYDEVFSGYVEPEAKLRKIFKSVFTSDNNEMVVVKDIDYFSFCEHHLVSFFGKVHVGYIPNGKVLGLSKFARLVEVYSRRLQIQEQLTFQIAEEIQTRLKPKGLGVIVTGKHLCMAMRGVQKLNSETTTSAMRGCFKEDINVRQEFLKLVTL